VPDEAIIAEAGAVLAHRVDCLRRNDAECFVRTAHGSLGLSHTESRVRPDGSRIVRNEHEFAEAMTACGPDGARGLDLDVPLPRDGCFFFIAYEFDPALTEVRWVPGREGEEIVTVGVYGNRLGAVTQGPDGSRRIVRPEALKCGIATHVLRRDPEAGGAFRFTLRITTAPPGMPCPGR
jgi:hypothetical protein